MATNDEITTREIISPSLINKTMSAAEKAKYFGVTAVTTAGLLEFAGAGALGLLAAAGIGGAAAFWSEEIREVLIDRIPTPKLKDGSRSNKLYWLLTGREGNDSSSPVDEPIQQRLTQAQVEDVQRTTERLSIPTAPGQKVSRQPVARLAEIEDDVIPLPRSQQQGKFLFSQVARSFMPSMECIFLGRTVDGKNIYCEAKDLCHVALAGNTGGGKSSIMRMLMLQLCYVGAQVLLLNPHYTRYDIEHDEDWTPFEPHLVADPMECRRYDVIEHYLKYIAETLVPMRLDRYAQSLPVGKPYFVVIDELPSIVRRVKDTPEYMKSILQEGRKVNVFLISAAQDFLVKSISPDSGGGSIRECYRTAYYVGGDPTTAKVLLDMPAKDIAEDELGKGVVMLRGYAPEVKKAAQALVPYVDNDALYRTLGPSTYVPAEDTASDDLPSFDQAVYQAQTRLQQPTQHQTRQVSTDDLESGIREQVAYQAYKPSAENTYRQKTTGMEHITANRSMQMRLAKAKELYTQGIQSSEHLAQAMGTNTGESSLLLRTLKENGIIDDGRKTQAMEPLPEVPETHIVTPIVKDKGTRADEIDINLAVTAWNNGWNSIEKLQHGFGITNYQAQRLRERILDQAGRG